MVVQRIHTVEMEYVTVCRVTPLDLTENVTKVRCRPSCACGNRGEKKKKQADEEIKVL